MMKLDFKLRVISPEIKMNEFHTKDLIFDGNFGIVHEVTDSGADPYTGEYEVTPLVDKETTLPTANKIMSRDVVVKQVPYFETSNNTGGKTVYIGKVE